MIYSRNPDWYRAKHALAVELVSWAEGAADEEKAMLLDRAERCVRDLLCKVDATLKRRVWGRQASSEGVSGLRRFLVEDVTPPALVLMAEIEAAKRSLENGVEPGEVAATAREVSAEESQSPDLNYALARLAVQSAALGDADKYLQVVVDATSRPQWSGLAHRIVRDPVLTEFAVSSNFEPEGEFRAYIDEAQAEAKVQGKARGADAPAAEAEASGEDAPTAGLD